MLPGDDELLPIGLDDSVSVGRTVASATTAVRCEVLMGEAKADGVTPVATGVRTTHRVERVTTYALTNNDAAKGVGRLYLDHTASSGSRGFAITTVDAAVKATPSGSFARYAFALGPLESQTFAVREEAEATADFTGGAAVRNFLQDHAPGLGRLGLLSPQDAERLASLAARADATDALDAVLKACRTCAAPSSPSGGSSKAGHFLKPNAWRLPAATGTPAAAVAAAWAGVLGDCDAWLAAEARCGSLAAQLTAHASGTAAVVESQERLRCNIKALEAMPGSKLMGRYMEDLHREEDELIAHRDATTALGEERRGLDADVGVVRARLAAAAEALRAAILSAGAE
jgi:hypothetical protein